MRFGLTASAYHVAGGGGIGIIGHNSIAANNAGTADNWTNQVYVSTAKTYVASSGDVVTAFFAYGDSTGGCDMAIYVVSGGVAGARVGSASTVSIGSGAAWYSTGVSIALTAGVRYGVAIRYHVGESWNIRFGDGPGGNQLSGGGQNSALPATWSDTGGDTNVVSFYAQVN